MLLAEAHEPFSIANAKEPHPSKIDRTRPVVLSQRPARLL